MKTFSILFFMLAQTSNAWSSQLLIKRLYTDNSVSAVFDFDQPTSRAWVELAITSSFSDSDDDYERVKVEGLSLEGDTIRFDLDGQSFECAKIKNRRLIFRYNVLQNTKECNFKFKKHKITVDDGFRLRKVNVTDVYLEVQK